MANTPLTIGCVAKAAEVNAETIRYYQRVALLIEPAKPSTESGLSNAPRNSALVCRISLTCWS